MSCRYQVRIFESAGKDGATSVGTIMAPVAQTFSVYVYSAEEAEKSIRKDIAKGKLARGRVYQILPLIGNAELTRSLAVALDGSFQRVFLDPEAGPYSEFRRVRLPQSTAASQPDGVASTLSVSC
ncbi:MAG TPA: hypothetical protein VHU83_17890 [Bryobacteraceae bacterium]|jgi:hypothetical protein|nr:hypothetical protein [Bryobacteraceae bacterium]